MKIKDLIKKLEEYPDDMNVRIMGFDESIGGCYEAWHSSSVKFETDGDELLIEGNLDF